MNKISYNIPVLSGIFLPITRRPAVGTGVEARILKTNP
jgi:hypothetical protein